MEMLLMLELEEEKKNKCSKSQKELYIKRKNFKLKLTKEVTNVGRK